MKFQADSLVFLLQCIMGVFKFLIIITFVSTNGLNLTGIRPINFSKRPLEKVLEDILDYIIVNISKTVYMFYEHNSAQNYGDIIERLSMRHKHSVCFKIYTYLEIMYEEHQEGNIRYPVIALFEDFHSIEEFNYQFVFLNIRLKSNFYFTYYPNASEEILDRLYMSLLHYQVFLYDTSDKSITLAIYTRFFLKDKAFCGKMYMHELNTLSNTLEWEKEINFPKRFQNFNGCPIVIRLLQRTDAVEYVYDDSRSHVVSFDGYLIKFIKTLAEKMNFIPVFNPVINMATGETQLNGRNDFFLELIATHMVIDASVIVPFIYTDVGFIIPLSRPYPAFMKLFLPFNLDPWIAIIAVFLLAIFIVTILNHLSHGLKHFDHDKTETVSISISVTNLFNLFFGGTQSIIPIRSSSRLLLITFIIYSLIIRTVYQGKLFEFLHSDPLQKDVQTIQDMIENDYTFMVPELFISVTQMEFLKR